MTILNHMSRGRCVKERIGYHLADTRIALVGGAGMLAILAASASGQTPMVPAAQPGTASAIPAATKPAPSPKRSIDPPNATATAPAPAKPLASDIYNMSLEDLMNVQVSTLFRVDERIDEAPRNIYRFDHDTISLRGITFIDSAEIRL
jgi:hypothetical protein